jgi:hypothetical protein
MSLVKPAPTYGGKVWWVTLADNENFSVQKHKSNESRLKSFITDIRKLAASEVRPFRILLKNSANHIIASADTEEDIMLYWKWILDNLMPKLRSYNQSTIYPYLIYFFTNRVAQHKEQDLSPLEQDEEKPQQQPSSTPSLTQQLHLSQQQPQAPPQTEQPLEDCKICYERECNTVIISCGHSVLCTHCAETLDLKTCPICRNPIEKIVQIYKS